MLNSKTHNTACLRLSEKSDTPVVSSGASAAASGPKQTTIGSHLKKMSDRQYKQLVKKFQLCHMTTANALSFNMYEKMATFENKVHGVHMGTAYTNQKSAPKILKCFALRSRIKKITNTLNDGDCNYYSVLFDGSSNDKTNNEKDIFLIKTCGEGTPKINVMSLQGGHIYWLKKRFEGIHK